jgi:archaellum component FlaC
MRQETADDVIYAIEVAVGRLKNIIEKQREEIGTLENRIEGLEESIREHECETD